ncbi:hypothetical protein DH2020_020449 [Rehmannia glutinosa]|uniref:Uncharacterized protein n=1 Tax=Rehmannia glutinosa TaxID=99300 RepID=A0ABR0WKV3_REHGL
MTKKALQEEIMNGLYAELRVLKGEKEELMDRSEEIVDKVFKSKREEESLMRKAKGGGDRIEKLREGRKGWEIEFNDISERIEEIEDLIARKETMALSVGVRELLFIERVTSGPPVTKLSKVELQKDLQDAHRLFQEQIILPSVMVSEDMESFSGQDSTAFALE